MHDLPEGVEIVNLVHDEGTGRRHLDRRPGVSIGLASSVMSWEYGTCRPSGAAVKLLSLVRKNPSVLIEA